MTSAELVWRNAKTNFNGKVVKGHERKVFRSRRCNRVVTFANYLLENDLVDLI